MSSPGSVALTLDLPARLLADRLTVGLSLAAGIAVEIVASGYPAGPPPGVGLGLGALLLAWQRRRLGRRAGPRRALLAHSGAWQLEFADGRRVPARLLGRSRVLGPTLVLRWRMDEGTCAAWLTGLDVPIQRLREVVVRLRAVPQGNPP